MRFVSVRSRVRSPLSAVCMLRGHVYPCCSCQPIKSTLGRKRRCPFAALWRSNSCTFTRNPRHAVPTRPNRPSTSKYRTANFTEGAFWRTQVPSGGRGCLLEDKGAPTEQLATYRTPNFTGIANTSRHYAALNVETKDAPYLIRFVFVW